MANVLPNVDEDTNNQDTQTSLLQCGECLLATPDVWCINCSVEYCSACWKKVHKGRVISQHRQVPIDEKPGEFQYCDIHPDEKLQYWCSCDTLICVDCQMTKQHKYHTSVPISAAVQDITKELRIEFKEIQTCLSQTITHGRYLKNKNKNNNIQSVTGTFDALRKTINNYEETVKNQIRQIDAKNNLLTDNYLTLLNNKQTTLSKYRKTLETITSAHDTTQLLKVKTKYADYIVELTKEMEELELPMRTEYQIIGINRLQENINDILKKIRIIEHKSENYEFREVGTYRELDCKGRPCILCGKCRDWYYAEDLMSWEWIRSHKDWKDDDWKNWNDNRIWEHFERRDGATCCLTSSFHFFAACLCEDNI